MKLSIRIESALLAQVRTDLARRHPFAWERVGFMAASAIGSADGILLLVRGYQPVADEDYVRETHVGAEIGSEAFRKALQWAYRPKSTLIHIHTHHGNGRPVFSKTDIVSGRKFVPSFFVTIPRMPQGMVVLSDDAATGLMWHAETDEPAAIDNFSQVGTGYQRDWSAL